LRGESEDGGRRSFNRRRGTIVGFQKNVEEGEASVCVKKGYGRVQKMLRKEKLQCAWRRVTVEFKKR